MKIVAENETARVEATIRVSSQKGSLVRDEIRQLTLYLGDQFIDVLTRAPYAHFTISNHEIKVK